MSSILGRVTGLPVKGQEDQVKGSRNGYLDVLLQMNEYPTESLRERYVVQLEKGQMRL